MIDSSPMNAKHGVEALHEEFQTLTGLSWTLPKEVAEALEAVFTHLGQEALHPAAVRHRELQAAINTKLRLNQAAHKNVLNSAADHRVYFNYHEKAQILRSLDYRDRPKFFEVMLRKSVAPRVLQNVAEKFETLSWEATALAFTSAMRGEERAEQIRRSIFAAFAFQSFKTDRIHNYFSMTESAHYLPRFYDYLRAKLPQTFQRPYGLVYWRIDDNAIRESTGDDNIREVALRELKRLSERLSNHCYLGVLIKPLRQGEGFKWRLYSDLVLFAEKSQNVNLKAGYFRPSRIAEQTQAYIPNLDLSPCQFDLAQEGLFYKDCFVIRYDEGRGEGEQQEPDLLLLFEKNERDETPIPCPACRSSDVQGNSYPVLGVRSWECNNLLCPERSKYDRGNRYSFASLMRQEAIEQEKAVIPQTSLRLWKRDVVGLASEEGILPMLIQHYSLLGDTVLAINTPQKSERLLGRKVQADRPKENNDKENGDRAGNAAAGSKLSRDFFDGPYFRRICVARPQKNNEEFVNRSGIKGAEVYCGDCFDVLSQMDQASVDGIVTSPPYYNAREYSTWPNVYCYLYDQFNVAQELFRVLRPGGLFLYNVFDYFDNENNVVFSAMGNKRMILGAYAINLFERVGFRIEGNVVWDKGEIEGKRNFNGGNPSPYYQAPFNCWEHVLVFRKGEATDRTHKMPYILRSQPVVKMIGGRNVLGHTAPFPEAIPNLLLDTLASRSTVLDPYSGSMTTARAAYKQGMRSISIDDKEEYCRLGLSLLSQCAGNLFSEGE